MTKECLILLASSNKAAIKKRPRYSLTDRERGLRGNRDIMNTYLKYHIKDNSETTN